MKKKTRKIVNLNPSILTKVMAQLINDVALPVGASKTFMGDEIRLGAVYVCDVTHMEIMWVIFQ